MGSNTLFVLKTNTSYDLFIHDPKYFYFTRNPDPAHSGVHKDDNPMELPYMWPFILTEVEDLNVPVENPDYNYGECIKDSFSRQVGCKTKWEKTLNDELPLCGILQDFV